MNARRHLLASNQRNRWLWYFVIRLFPFSSRPSSIECKIHENKNSTKKRNFAKIIFVYRLLSRCLSATNSIHAILGTHSTVTCCVISARAIIFIEHDFRLTAFYLVSLCLRCIQRKRQRKLWHNADPMRRDKSTSRCALMIQAEKEIARIREPCSPLIVNFPVLLAIKSNFLVEESGKMHLIRLFAGEIRFDFESFLNWWWKSEIEQKIKRNKKQ